VTAEQIVIAAEVTVDSPDFGHLEPMVSAAEAELASAGIDTVPEVVLADAGYWHQVQMEAIVDRGMQVLIPPDAGKRKGARPGWDGGLYAFMRRVLATDRGGELYAKRQGMIEPVFADTKFNRRCDRFQRRGRSAARSEWRLITATHNCAALAAHHGPHARLSRRAPRPPRPLPRKRARDLAGHPQRARRLSATATMASGGSRSALPIFRSVSCPTCCSMPPAVADHRPRCRASTPADRRATRAVAIPPIHPPSRRSSPSCARPAQRRTACECEG
jgi:hypothetical protein